MKSSIVFGSVAIICAMTAADESRRDPALADIPGVNSVRSTIAKQATAAVGERRVSLPARIEVADDSTPIVDNGWNPKLMVRLDLVPGGQTQVEQQTRTIMEPYFKKSARGAAELEYRSVQRTVAVTRPGQAVVGCDDVSISVTPNDNGDLIYDVTCSQKSRLVLPGMTIDCDSITMKAGLATCTNAAIKNRGIKATATSLVIDLNVVGVQTSKFGQPVSSLSCTPGGMPFLPTPEGSRIQTDSFGDEDAWEPRRGDGIPPVRELDRKWMPDSPLQGLNDSRDRVDSEGDSFELKSESPATKERSELNTGLDRQPSLGPAPSTTDEPKSTVPNTNAFEDFVPGAAPARTEKAADPSGFDGFSPTPGDAVDKPAP